MKKSSLNSQDWISFLAFQFYRWFLAPLLIFLLKSTARLWPKKIRQMLRSRHKSETHHLNDQPIWVHASSGEIEYAKSLLRELRQRWPARPLLVTYFSPSAEPLLKKVTEATLILPLPWDLSLSCQKFLQTYKPLCGLFARTDVWPEMAYQANQQGIPLLLFSATLAAKSRRKFPLARWINRWALNQLSQIQCVSPEDQTEFEKLKVRTPIQVCGDTRFDQALYRIAHPNLLKDIFRSSGNLQDQETQSLNDSPILALGSTWPEDERVLLSALAGWLADGNRVIWAPHEVEPAHLNQLIENFQSKKWTWSRYSDFADSGSWTTQILLVDQVGLLADLYLKADVAFVGGSFREKVHSVMEPLTAGLPVLLGPHFENNREAIIFQKVMIQDGIPCVQTLRNSAEFQRGLLTLKPFLKSARHRQWIQQKVQQNAGATRWVVEWIEDQSTCSASQKAKDGHD